MSPLFDKEVVCVIGLAFLFAGLVLSAPKAQAFDNPPIRVRLESSLPDIELEGTGVQIHGREKAFEPVAIPKRQKIQITQVKLQNQMVWKVVRGGFEEIIGEKFLAIKAMELRADGKLLPNQVFLAPAKVSRFDVVGILPLEDYLVGVIASEMPLNWPIETLKAQAIAARSYALGTMKERAKQTFHVESTILDQVFTHIGQGPDESPLIAKAKEAVQETKGMVLISSPSRVLKAFYHSDCGGKTTDAKAVWGMGPSTGEAVDASCPSNPRANWNLQVEESSLSRKLKTFLKRQSLGNLQVLNLIRPSVKDRVQKVNLRWDSGEQIQMAAADFRAAIGFDQLKSTKFEMKKTESGYHFVGRGFGHGVGLCQWGARQMGQQGREYQEILAHYYPKASIQMPGSALQANTRTEPELERQTR